jgi:hypothetical protein
MLLPLLIFLSVLVSEKAWATSVTMVSSSICEGVAETPILASQLNGIASISIKINYDTTRLNYLGVRNVHPGIANALITTNAGKFIVAWFSLNPVQIGNDTLMVVRWAASNYGTSTLQFDTQTPGNCEITNLQGTPLGVQFISGSVQISGARPPQPLNPLRLSNLNQSSYLFLYRRNVCMQQALLQIARDSMFGTTVLSTVMPDTTYLYSIPALAPAQGDSILWWRMGGVYNGDTSWSALGRMGFSISLAVSSTAFQATRLYPNPMQSFFWIQHPAFELDPFIQLTIRDALGRLLWQENLQAQDQRIYVQPNLLIPNQQLYIHWHNKIANGSAIAMKSTY